MAVAAGPQVSKRTRGMRATKVVTSPWDPTAQFTIRKASNREDVERQNFFSKVRTIQNLGTPNELIVERDIAMGDVQVDTIVLCTDDWNLADENNEIYPIMEETVLDFLKVAERRWLYDEILDFNPMWKGEEEEKVGSEAISSPNSNPSLEAGK